LANLLHNLWIALVRQRVIVISGVVQLQIVIADVFLLPVKMKILFLDFDGVLNSYSYLRSKKKEKWDRESDSLDPAAIMRLNRIIEKTGAVVVISSSWRRGRSTKQLASLLNEQGFTGIIIDKTIDDAKGRARGEEIKMWLDEHFSDVEAFVALDDDADMAAVSNNHIKTNLFAGGLLDEHVERAIEILVK
jgi:histidinol phosphatase-like enzyme